MAAAALSVSDVLALAASARSSSKELGALRPFCGVNITSCRWAGLVLTWWGGGEWAPDGFSRTSACYHD